MGVRRGAGALLATIAVLLGAPAASAADGVPPDATWRELEIPSADGTRLHLDVFRPKGAGRTPVILIPSRYFGVGFPDDPGYPNRLEYYDDLFAQAFRRGYSIVQLTVRGYGNSGGCTDWIGPGERGDTIAAIHWARSQPWSTGRVGTYGLSYDGALQFAALTRRVPGHAAAVLIGAPPSQYEVFYMRGVRYMPFAVVEAPYALIFTFPSLSMAGLQSAPRAVRERALNPGCPLQAVNWANPDPKAPYWRARDKADRAARTRVPILWSQGTLDWSIHPDGVDRVWGRLRGPKRLWLGQHAHDVPRADVSGRDGWIDEVFRFLDRHVRGAERRADPPVEVQDGSEGRWRAEGDWPPRDARAWQLPLKPGTYRELPGNKAEPYCLRLEAPCVPGPAGSGSWSISEPLPAPAHLSGPPAVKLEVSAPTRGPVTSIALLYDIDPLGRAALVTRGAAKVGPNGTATVKLYSQDWRFRWRHRIGVLLTGADDWTFEPGLSGVRIEVRGGTARLPLLRCRRDRFLAGGMSPAIRDRSVFDVGPGRLSTRTVRASPPAQLRRNLGTPVAPRC